MEENPKHLRKKAKGKTRKIMNSKKLKKIYEMLNPEANRCKSCKNLINFVPRITPKKSYCIPSLLILNPDVKEKKHSDDIKNNLFFEKDSIDNSRELSLESSKDEKNNNLTNEIIINNNIQSENLGINLKDDCNLKNKSDFKENICNIYDTGEYLTILDILSMNKSNIV